MESEEYGKLVRAFGREAADAAVKSGRTFAEAAVAGIIELGKASPSTVPVDTVAAEHGKLVAGGMGNAEAWEALRKTRPLAVAAYMLR